MAFVQAVKRALLRGVVCATALGAGAALARVTERSATSHVPRLSTVAHALEARTATRTLDMGQPQLIVPDEAALDVGPAGTAPQFGNGLAITGATEHRLILFTFDDGPDHHHTPKLLHYLDDAGVRAVFFVLADRIKGQNVRERRQAEIAREIVRRGHIIGSHTVDHVQLPTLKDFEVVTELNTSQEIIERVIGSRPWLLRPPGGARSPRIDALVQSRGYTIMLWNIGAGDYQVKTADEVVDIWRRVLERREREEGQRGGIVLLHDIYAWSVEAFPRIVAEIRERNCDLLERGEELYDIVDDPSFFFAPRGDAPYGTNAPAAQLDPNVLEARQARLRDETAARCARLAAFSTP